jgi:hypothetical protein
MPRPKARSAITMMGTAIAAARAPLEVPAFFAAAVEELDGGCVLAEEEEEDAVEVVGENDADDEGLKLEVVAAPA